MKRWIAIFILLISCTCSGQEILLRQKTEHTLNDSDFGPNKKKYLHNIFGIGFNLSLHGDKVSLIYGGSSFSLSYGIRRKRKLSNTIALGYDLRYEFNQFRFKNHEGSLFTQVYAMPAPDSLVTDKLSYSAVQLAPYFRINFGKRGDHLGKYLDFAVYGELMVSSRHIIKYDHPNDNMVRKSTHRSRRLAFTNKLFYGLEARYGNSYYNLYFRYRLEDFFNDKLGDDIYRIPAFNAGLFLFIAR